MGSSIITGAALAAQAAPAERAGLAEGGAGQRVAELRLIHRTGTRPNARRSRGLSAEEVSPPLLVLLLLCCALAGGALWLISYLVVPTLG